MSRLQAEAQVRRLLKPQLALELATSRFGARALRSTATVLACTEFPSPSARFQALAASRLADDLRVLDWSTLSGYLHQACTIASALHELALLASFVGMLDERAVTWFEWSDSRRLPWRPKEIREGALKHAQYPGMIGESVLDAGYMTLCLFKHANPAIFETHGPVATPEGHVIAADPDVSPKRVGITRLAYYFGLGAITLYVHTMATLDSLPKRAEPASAQLLAGWLELHDALRSSLPPRTAT